MAAAEVKECPLNVSQIAKFPRTRFMGSKQRILPHIWDAVSDLEFDSVLDLFCGTAVVSYLFKAQGKSVLANDHMAVCANWGRALIENSASLLDDADLATLSDETTPANDFVVSTFAGLYYSPEDSLMIDRIRANCGLLADPSKQALAMAALVRACMKKRARGIFTFVGNKYDDGRRDLRLDIGQHFRQAVDELNAAVFDNGFVSTATWGEAMTITKQADLVYIDPPYYSPLSDNEYVRRYHFVEGLVRGWKGVEIQWHTRTRKFRKYPTPFGTRDGANAAFESLFKQHRKSILVVSYSSNSLPSMSEMLALLRRVKRRVEVIEVPHRYHFGNQGHKVGNPNNSVQEYIFVGS